MGWTGIRKRKWYVLFAAWSDMTTEDWTADEWTGSVSVLYLEVSVSNNFRVSKTTSGAVIKNPRIQSEETR